MPNDHNLLGRRLQATVLSTMAILVALFALDCRWREGRSVLINSYDSGADAEKDALTDVLDGGCIADQGGWVSSEDLLGLIISEPNEIVLTDIRPREECEAARIPGAQCHPLIDGELVPELDVSDEDSWLVLYDSNGGGYEDALASLPSFCYRRVVVLDGGFGAWAARGDYPIEEGEP